MSGIGPKNPLAKKLGFQIREGSPYGWQYFNPETRGRTLKIEVDTPCGIKTLDKYHNFLAWLKKNKIKPAHCSFSALTKLADTYCSSHGKESRAYAIMTIHLVSKGLI